MRRITGAVIVSLVMLGGALVALLGTSVANAWTNLVYVSPAGSSWKADTSCATAGFRSINAAVKVVASRGTVIVCRGTYHTQVVIRKPVKLDGEHAVINARGQKPVLRGLPAGSGIVVLRTRDVHVTGFTVRRAGYDAILVALSSRVLVTHNVLEHSGGVGVDFNGTSYSRASRNASKFNAGGGFLVADDLGPARHDTINWNVASRNRGGCGVIVAGHSTFGVRDNRVAHNWLTYNGTRRKSPGAGVVIATEVPGETVSGNTVTGNWIYHNGLAGVTIHSHVKGQHLNGNVIAGNWIGKNNVVGDPIGLRRPAKNMPDRKTTGILVGASSHVHVVIRGNHISRDWYGVFLEGRVRAKLRHNHFRRVRWHVKVVN